MTPANGLKTHKLITLRLVQHLHGTIHMLQYCTQTVVGTVASTGGPRALLITLHNRNCAHFCGLAWEPTKVD
jgi:hypothetical protein